MKRHLTEKQLIEYQFKLADDRLTAVYADHLAACEQCRGHLAQVERRFSSLDLLKDEVRASDELIARTLAQAARPRRGRVVRLWPAWASAAAAVIVIATVLLVNNLTQDKSSEKPVPEYTRLTTPPIRPAQEYGHQPAVQIAPSQRHELGLAYPEKPGADVLAAAADQSVIDEQAPFAPASAIELVTLPRRDKVQITIYNSADLTLVREQRNLTLKRGWNWLQFMWANTLIDPTSLSIEPQEQKDKINVQQLVFPPRLRELGRWLIRSEVSGQVPFELVYFTSGLSWRAFYMGTLSQDEAKMDLKGYVRVTNNSGEDYENAQTRLLVGTVHLLDEISQLAGGKHAYGRPEGEEGEKGGERRASVSSVYGTLGGRPEGRLQVEQLVEYASKPKEIVKEGLSEYFLYTIEGTETIPNTWGKRLLSFEANDVKIESLYKYDEERWGDQTIRFVKFANNKDHNLGQTPIPDGDVRIYGLTGNEGHLSYVGGTSIKYIPVDEEIELELGSARLVKVEPRLMDFKTENFIFDRNNDISGWDEVRKWTIDIANTRTLPMQIEVTRGFETTYWTIELGDPGVLYEKHDASHARFKLTIPPRGKKAFDYTVRTYHGQREQAMTQ
jgi:hypothetical protein